MDNLFSFEPVEPVSPAAAWIGGKRSLAKRLVNIIDQIPHECYCEPFMGMGGVFFRRDKKPKVEVINDRSRDVVNLFRILQRHYPQFMETLKYQISSRREFERLKASDPDTLTDLERAARFLYLQRHAFGGRVAGQNFGVSLKGSARFNLNNLAPILEAIHERLSCVTFENLDWLEFIDRYDRSGTLFYLDPPYFGGEDDYGKGMFAGSDFDIMSKRLADLQGRFVLSINDKPEIRATFSNFRFVEAKLNYSLAGGKGSEARELIITDNKEPHAANV